MCPAPVGVSHDVRDESEVSAVGRLYDLIQAHIDAQLYPPSERQIAKELGVTQTTLSNWRTPRRLIDKEHLIAIAEVTRNPYAVVRDALLEDIGYLRPDDRPATPPPSPPVKPRATGTEGR